MCAISADFCNWNNWIDRRVKRMRCFGRIVFVLECLVLIMTSIEYFGFWKWVIPAYKSRADGLKPKIVIERHLILLESAELGAVVTGLTLLTWILRKLGAFWFNLLKDPPSNVVKTWIEKRNFLLNIFSVMFLTLIYYFGIHCFYFPGFILPAYFLLSGNLFQYIWDSIGNYEDFIIHEESHSQNLNSIDNEDNLHNAL